MTLIMTLEPCIIQTKMSDQKYKTLSMLQWLRGREHRGNCPSAPIFYVGKFFLLS